MRGALLAVAILATAPAISGCSTINGVLHLTHKDETKALLVATQTMDGIVNSAEAAHKTGLIVGDNWTKTKSVLQKMQDALVLAQASYVAGNQSGTEAQLQAFAALVPEAQALIASLRGAQS